MQIIFLKMSLVLKILKKFLPLTKTSHLVYFSSTEPLSAANFREIFINSKKYKTEKYLSTNGIQITDEIAKSFVKEELNFLTVSFGGLTEKTFIKAHKVNKLQDVLKKVDLINIYKKNIILPILN